MDRPQPLYRPVFVFSLFLLIALMCGPLKVSAQRQNDSTPPAEAPVSEAPVSIDGRVLFYVRGVRAYPAKRRADLIVKDIRTLAQSTVPTKNIKIVENEQSSVIMAADQILMEVLDADAQLENISRSVLAEAYKIRIEEAVNSYREERTSKALLVNGIYTLIATVLMGILLFLLWKLFQLLIDGFEKRYRERIENLEIKGVPILTPGQAWDITRSLIQLVRVLTVVAVVYAYLEIVLNLYPWTRPVANRLASIVAEPITSIAIAFFHAIPDLVFLTILFFFTRYVLKFGKLVFSSIAERRVQLKNFDAEWAWPTYRIFRMFIVAFALVVAYPYIPGSDTEAFKGITIFLGVIFSLGSSTVISNLIAGYTMTYRRAFRVGDRIRIQDTVGDVMEMRMTGTHVLSLNNEEIVIPNSVVLNSEVVNYTTHARQRGLILPTTVGIGYDVPWRQVESMLKMAAKRTPGVLREPPPFVLQKALRSFDIEYELKIYCDDPLAMEAIYSQLHSNILDVFNEYSVQIMTPAYECDPAEEKVVSKEQWFTAPAVTDDSQSP